MENGIDPRVLASVDQSRRDLVRKLLMGSAFVLPAVASFPMDALAQAGTVHLGNNTGFDTLQKGSGQGNPAKVVPDATANPRLPSAGTPGGPGNVLGPGGQVTPNIPLTPATPAPKPPSSLPPPPPRPPRP